MRIDALQFCAYDEAILDELRRGRVDAVHVTISYHEGLRDALRALSAWNRLFERHDDRICHAVTAADIDRAKETGRTAVFLGFQNPLPIEDDLGLVGHWHRLGVRFLQPTYNNQSLLGSGWQEPTDCGLTRFGKIVVARMNELGFVVDLSHAGERTALDTIEASTRPVAVTHANPRWFRETGRNVSESVIAALAASGGMLGFSLYPHHLCDGSACTLDAFCAMAARVAERHGAGFLGFGSDLCQGQPDAAVEWMRSGRWTQPSDPPARFPAQPSWFRSNTDWDGIEAGLRRVGFSADETAGIMGANWYRYLSHALEPAT